MIRLISLLITITVLSLGAAWLADEPGRVVIDWGDYHIETSLLVVLAGVAIAALWCMIVYYVLFAILRTPRSWLRSRLARRQQLGLEALTGAFAAIATQDIRGARKHIKRAQQYLPHQPLTLMLASQVARLEGNDSQSRLYLEQMLKAEGTEFMALRGLIESARRNHDYDNALLHAEKALALRPNDAWLTTAIVGLYAGKQRTDDALRLIGKAARKRTISKQEQRTLTAGVLYEYAKPLIGQQRFDLSLPALAEALRYQPSLTPASALLATTYRNQGNIPQALKVITAAWKTAPHPLLTQALLQCFEPEKTRHKVTRAAEKMAALRPEHPESAILRASIALKEGQAEKALSALKPMVESHETVRGCTLMAEVESALGDSAQSSQWLKRSHSARHEPDFTCDNCRKASDAWYLTCQHCGSVGTISMAG